MLSKLCPAAAAGNPRAPTAVEPDSTGLSRVLGTGGYPAEMMAVKTRPILKGICVVMAISPRLRNPTANSDSSCGPKIVIPFATIEAILPQLCGARTK